MHYPLVDAPRFISPSPLRSGKHYISLDPNETQHAIKVLRLKEGNALELCDGAGTVVKATVDSINRKEKAIQVMTADDSVWYPELKPEIVLCVGCGSLKGGRGDWLIEKATELGASRFVPLLCDRSQTVPEARLNRWHRISVAAMKQCLRPYFMKIEKPIQLGELLKNEEAMQAHYFLTSIKGDPLLSVFQSIDHGETNKVVLLVGPEGDFTEREKELAIRSGCISVSLGPHRLRVETAAIATLSIVHLACINK